MNKISCIANFVKKCPCVYDVGSDHAHLAIFLLENKIAKRVVNIEINTKPLTHGLHNLIIKKLQHKTSNIINDGLKNITRKTKTKPSYICIAGMGGNNIINILKSRDKKLPKCFYVLQANTEFVLLRKWLAKNKWQFIKEQVCYDRKHYYQIMLVKPSTKTTKLNTFNQYFGFSSKQKDKQTFNDFIAFTKKKIKDKKLDKYSNEYEKLYAAVKER